MTLVLIKEYTGKNYRDVVNLVELVKLVELMVYRRKMRDEFDENIYHYRNLAETMFSVLERKYREELRTRKYRNQVKEVKFKFLFHNIGRAISVSVIIQMSFSTEPFLHNSRKYQNYGCC
ncbi:MAG: transposase IS4 family protein [Methanohalophilus sp. T328-1]|jgi:hypothetical protein|uniref:Transposase DDE domain-containing protein n=1 Tax=Methanohalophilus euhalobius TaxID=51203 RepID=A0A285F9Q2_9EURY|nr:MAG: transposase IS4 family protein [Methanohalophilus sp. T328-1]OBZ35719.1 MAG: hypothetical protein A9957_06195 [Methanohalophilus sp. DAL1]ODV50105.1 MAG: transposase IS4 family protein [Methanohalophilus sp. 2-GBenrich]RSD33850.1 MAG: transposase IS4 family protein [Methanohalophilus sp.]RXG33625.1 transposase IS4 family protein [Methanohalophilus sp. WG1-DM]TCL12206.1 hypothetical protein C7960_1436 [Methanohalophilus euhalobius]